MVQKLFSIDRKRGGGLDSMPGLLECRLFKSLTLAELREIASCATPIKFEKGSFIFESGDVADYLYIVQEGFVKLHTTSPAGKVCTYAITLVGDSLNSSALSIGTYFVSARALTDVTVLQIEKEKYFAFVRRFPNLALEVINALASGLKEEHQRMVDDRREEADRRIAQGLLTLATKLGATFHLTREEFAEYVGTSTETAIRALGRLKKKGIVSCSSHRREIVVSDLEKLESFVS